MIIPSAILKSLFLAPLIVIGIITSISDIKYGKIKNIHLFFGLLYISSLYFFLFFYSYFIIHQISNYKYLIELIINGSIALFVGYFLWYFNLWAAGDAKLFFLYSLLIPLEFYSENYVLYFPSSVLLVDTFIIICFTLYINCFNSLRKKPITSYFSKINYKVLIKTAMETVKMLLIVIFFLIILEYIKLKIEIIFKVVSFNPFLYYLLFFALQIFVLRIFLKNKTFIILIILSGLLSCLGFVISGQTALLITIIKSSFFLMFFVTIGMQLANFYIEKQEIKKTKIHLLRSGSFLTQHSLTEIINKIKGQKSDHISLTCSDGLSESQIQVIQKLFKNDSKKEIYICKTFPFAPFMFSAFIFTIIFNRSFLFFLLYYIGYLR